MSVRGTQRSFRLHGPLLSGRRDPLAPGARRFFGGSSGMGRLGHGRLGGVIKTKKIKVLLGGLVDEIVVVFFWCFLVGV